jgi:hypothetical protein
MDPFYTQITGIQTCIKAPVIRYWNFGYQPATLLKIMNSLPKTLTLLVEQVFEALTDLVEKSNENMRSVHTMLGPDAALDTNSLAGFNSNLFSHFESEMNAGLIMVKYDPITQSRKNVILNTFLARVWGMTKDELLLRFADYDVPLPYSELDWLRTLLFELETHFDTTTARYSRLIFGTGQAARAVLVQVTTSKRFDAVGQLVMVRRCSSTSIPSRRSCPPPSHLFMPDSWDHCGHFRYESLCSAAIVSHQAAATFPHFPHGACVLLFSSRLIR